MKKSLEIEKNNLEYLKKNKNKRNCKRSNEFVRD